MKSSIIITALLLVLAGCGEQPSSAAPAATTISQAELDQLANSLYVNYTLVANNGDGNCLELSNEDPCFVADTTLMSPADLNVHGWEIYFNQNTPLVTSQSEELIVEHVNGGLHVIRPTVDFTGFKSGESKLVRTVSRGLTLTESMMMPNYYIVADGLTARNIKSTALTTDPETGLEVRGYASGIDPLTQFKRSPGDETPLATADFLYRRNQDTVEDTSVIDAAILPSPMHMEQMPGRLEIGNGLEIRGAATAVDAASAAVRRLEALGIHVVEGGAPVDLSIEPETGKTPGSYLLTIEADGIAVVGADPSGVAHGVQSLASLHTLGGTSLPLVEVRDEPRYKIRGMHVDVARNFHSKNFILDLIDQMAAYKLNTLHLHLGEDEAWRLQIRDLPELTDVGSKRCHDPEENDCLIMQLGSGVNNETVDGFYTIEDYIKILRAADENHIQVIPSFDMPGHSRAIIKAMEARYRKYMAEGDEEEANRYRLIDPEDRTVYRSIQYYSDNTINVCIDSTYSLISKIIEEMKAVHETAGQPLTVYHIGADETAGAWLESPRCQGYMKEQGISDVGQLSAHFVERVSGMLEEMGIKAAGWNDGMGHTDFNKMPAVVQSNVWDVLPWTGVANQNRQVNHGWDVVLSTPDVLYFDFPYEADPREPGNYWASRHINTRKVFEFMPDNVPVMAELWKGPQEESFEINDTFQKDEDGNITHRPIEKGKRVKGMQGQIWSEIARSDDWTEYQVYPRLLALAERAWHTADWEVPYNHEGAVYNNESGVFSEERREALDGDWQRFANVIALKEMPKLDRAGIFYRIPTTGAVIENGKLMVNSIFPGLPIEFRVNGGDWETYRRAVPVEAESDIDVRAMTTDKSRKGRAISIE